MALSTLQKERIAYHLDFVRSEYIPRISANSILITASPSQELALVGPDLGTLDPAEIFVFEGSDLCSNSSMLGKVERAFSKIDPATIEDSLYVQVAGSVTLRGNELKNRENLYKTLVKKLSKLMGDSVALNRVGW